MTDGVVCRLVKQIDGKVIEECTISTNEFGWCKSRTSTGEDKWFKSKSELTDYIEAKLRLDFEFEGKLNLPEKVVSRYAAFTEDI